jgi:hypothetical protein
MATDSVILVTGATGLQSSALIKRLALYSYCASTRITIHATTRNPLSPAAQALLANSSPTCIIKLIKADFDDAATLTIATTNVTHAFLVFVPNLSDPSLEQQHAQNMLSALEHNSSMTLHRLVYSGSVASLHSPETYATSTPPIHPSITAIYAGKYATACTIREFAQRHSLAYTLLAPGTFLTNFFPPTQRVLYPFLAPGSSLRPAGQNLDPDPFSPGDAHSENRSGNMSSPPQPRIITALDPSTPLAWVDPADMASFAADALMLHSLDRRYRLFYNRAELKVAGQRATMAEVTDVLNRVLRSNGLVSTKEGSDRSSSTLKAQLRHSKQAAAATHAPPRPDSHNHHDDTTSDASSTAGTEEAWTVTETETEPTDTDMDLSPRPPPLQPSNPCDHPHQPQPQITLEHIDAATAAHAAATNLLLGTQHFQNINPWIHDVDLPALRAGGVRLAGLDDFFARDENRLRLRRVVFGE